MLVELTTICHPFLYSCVSHSLFLVTVPLHGVKRGHTNNPPFWSLSLNMHTFASSCPFSDAARHHCLYLTVSWTYSASICQTICFFENILSTHVFHVGASIWGALLLFLPILDVTTNLIASVATTNARISSGLFVGTSCSMFHVQVDCNVPILYTGIAMYAVCCL